MTLILIADDDDDVATLLEKGLARAGYATARVATGVAAVEATRSAEVALVLLDVGLPDLDGVTAMAMMRAIDPAIPILLVTGRDESRDVGDGHRCRWTMRRAALRRSRARRRCGASRARAESVCGRDPPHNRSTRLRFP